MYSRVYFMMSAWLIFSLAPGSEADLMTCNMVIRVDVGFWIYMRGLGLTDTQSDLEIHNMIRSHVQYANDVFSEVELIKNNATYNGINFRIDRVMVDKLPPCPLCDQNLDVKDMLERMAKENYLDYCLAYFIAFRPELSVQNSSRASMPVNDQSGVCANPRSVQSVVHTDNVGVVNFNNALTQGLMDEHNTRWYFIHALASSLGYKGQYDTCTPIEVDPGDGSMNISKCARENMSQTLSVPERRDCLVPGVRGSDDPAPVCGNGMVEDGEECDCLNSADPCCVCDECLLNADSQCSPSQGACCLPRCVITPKSDLSGTYCSAETDCATKTICSGDNVQCGKPVPKIAVPCSTKESPYRFCKGGTCGTVALFCENARWPQCFASYPEYNRTDMCILACRNPSTGKCISTADSDALSDPENEALKRVLPENDVIRLSLGNLCDDGFCAEDRSCHPFRMGMQPTTKASSSTTITSRTTTRRTPISTANTISVKWVSGTVPITVVALIISIY